MIICKNKNRFAFTLIELLVVIAIIALLSSIVMVSLKGAREKAQIAKVLQWSRSVKAQLGGDIVGDWNFNEGQGTTAYSATGYNNGTLGGTCGASCVPTWTDGVQGLTGKALYFDGVDDYVNIANAASLNPTSITIEMWLYLATDPNCDAGNNWRALLYKGATAGTATGYDIVLEEGKSIAWDTGTGVSDRWWPPGISILIGSWTHLVLSYDSSGIKQAYQNGVLKASKSVASASLASNANNLRISNSSVACPAGSGAFPGTIDEVRIYGRALTAMEIQKHYAKGLERHQLVQFNFNEERPR